MQSYSEIQKVVTDILKELEQAQWGGAGVAIMAYMWEHSKVFKIINK